MYGTCRLNVSHVSRMANGYLPDETRFELVQVYAEVCAENHVSLHNWYVLVLALDTSIGLLLCTQDISRELLSLYCYHTCLYYMCDGIVLPCLLALVYWRHTHQACL